MREVTMINGEVKYGEEHFSTVLNKPMKLFIANGRVDNQVMVFRNNRIDDSIVFVYDTDMDSAKAHVLHTYPRFSDIRKIQEVNDIRMLDKFTRSILSKRIESGSVIKFDPDRMRCDLMEKRICKYNCINPTWVNQLSIDLYSNKEEVDNEEITSILYNEYLSGYDYDYNFNYPDNIFEITNSLDEPYDLYYKGIHKIVIVDGDDISMSDIAFLKDLVLKYIFVDNGFKIRTVSVYVKTGSIVYELSGDKNVLLRQL